MKYIIGLCFLIFTISSKAQENLIPLDTILTSGSYSLIPKAIESYDRSALLFYAVIKMKKKVASFPHYEELYKEAQNKIKIYLDDLISYMEGDGKGNNYNEINKELKSALITISRLSDFQRKYYSYSDPNCTYLQNMLLDNKMVKKLYTRISTLEVRYKERNTSKPQFINEYRRAYWKGL